MRTLTFNDLLMLFVAVPLILSWLIVSVFVIYSGIMDDTGMIQTNLDFYIALIAIVGGPALLFINSILEAWKTEQLPDMRTLGHSQDVEMIKLKNGKTLTNMNGFKEQE
jgi:hypothetical protein